MSLIDKLPKVKGSYRQNARLPNWFDVGGNAEILFRPSDIDDLSHFLKNYPKDIQITILGAASNVIIHDDGIKGVVIRLPSAFSKISHSDNLVTAGASALCANVALYCQENGLSNLEFLSTIPGSIGGATAMNAGCYGSDMSENLVKVLALDYDGNLVELSKWDFDFGYRYNNLSSKFIFLNSTFETKYLEPKKVKEKIDLFIKKRQETQPIRAKTGGSTFKNPDNCDKKAWQLIDEVGLRGSMRGGAQFSKKHCNFLINNNQASAQDLIELGEEARKKVEKKTGIKLSWEIKLLK